MKQTLEKIVNKVRKVGNDALRFVKDNARVGVMLAGVGLGAYFMDKLVPKAYAEGIKLTANIDDGKGGDYYAEARFGSKFGATERYDIGIDAEYIPPMPTSIGAFSVINDDPNKLRENFKDPNSITDDDAFVETIGVGIGGNKYWKIVIFDTNDIEWKNILFERYDKDANMADPNINPISVWDVKYKNGNGFFKDGYLPTQNSGIADKLRRKSFNHADLNRDRKVNGLDYAILADNWLRTGIEKGSDPNNLDDYADIQDIYDINGVMTSYGDGVVDGNDLGEFVGEWLWDANDANTW